MHIAIAYEDTEELTVILTERMM